MMESKTVGYIVEGRWGTLCNVNGVLYSGTTATLFPTREAATKAVKDTLAYAVSQGYNTFPGNPWAKGTVRRLVKI